MKTNCKRIMVMILCVALLMSGIPASSESGAPSVDCNHVCDGGTCAYGEGAGCAHTHDGDCDYAEAIPCDHDCEAAGCADPCAHSCDDGSCAYVAGADCGHEHDGNCGYMEAAPCDHEHDESCGGLSLELELGDENSTVIASFATPAQAATVALGTSYGDLPLPETVEATLEDAATPTDIPLDWTDEDSYDGDVLGDYDFTAVPLGYSLADGVDAPVFTVTVAEEEAGQIVIASFDALPEEVALLGYAPGEIQSGDELNLPDTLTGKDEEGNPLTIPGVIWECTAIVSDPEAPIAFEPDAMNIYEFTAALPEGYAVAEGVALPVITVVIRSEGMSMALTNHNIANGDITCREGGIANAYTITGASTSNRVIIDAEDAHQNAGPIYVTLRDVSIDLTGKEHSPVEVTQGTKAVITIAGTTTLVGGRMNRTLSYDDGCAGLAVKDGAEVTLKGDGTLNATGGGDQHGAAGIGSSYGSPMGKLTIQGNLTIVAKGTQGGAGIGGGNGHGSSDTSRGGDVTSLTIEGGNITATGGENAAGIGSGEDGDCSGIEINNNTSGTSVTIKATGGKNGAGIGSGEDGDATGIKISGGDNITAKGGENGAGIGSGSGGDCSNIEILGGTITATGGKSGAGIGGGKDGKTDGITISRGDITAQGGEGAAGIGGSNGDCGTITISGGVITSAGGKRGAGIGGGDDGKMTHIAISGGTITATGGERAAGIGGGDHDGSGDGGDVDSIEITGGTITLAQGGEGAAGIGGSDNGAVKSITINGATVQNAQGGNHAAGIGGGYKGEVATCRITITDSNINATGGYGGAGIGSGARETIGDPNYIHSIVIEGASKITAKGGHNGAGIGSGKGGSIGNITLTLIDTSGRDYYVDANGGDYAADIGMGSVMSFENSDIGLTTWTIDQRIGSITINGGYIKADIIGCYSVPYVSDLVVTGGYIEAKCVGAYYSQISHSPDGAIRFVFSGGTVDADAIVTDFDNKGAVIIDGGSVRAEISAGSVKNSSGSPVYKTTMTLADGAYTLLSPLSVSVSGYGTKSIYTDGIKKVYFYFLESGKVSANFGLSSYYGPIGKNNSNVLKMDGALNFKSHSSDVVVGEPFTLWLDDGSITGTNFAFEASGAAAINTVNQASSPGANVTLNATGFGSYTVTAEAEVNNPIYWKWVASYSGSTSKAAGKISIIENPSTIYGGTAVGNPSVSANSAGAVTYTYYEGTGTSGTPLGAAPTDAGTYTVVAQLAATSRYTAATSAPVTFTIAQRGLTMGISTESSGKVTVQLFNAVNAQGKIKISLWKDDTLVSGSEVTQDVAALSGSGYGVSYTYSTIPAGTYTIQADYIPASSGGNYICVNSPMTIQRVKELTTRTIGISALPTAITYGDNSFNLSATTADMTSNDRFTYAVVLDEYDKYEDAAGPVEDSVSVDTSGEVSILNAGTSYIKITLTDESAPKTYDDAVLFVPVTVAPAPLSVTPHATKGGERVTEADYGTVGELGYELEYSGLKAPDDETNFTNGHGTLRAKTLDPTLEVSDTPYSIEVEQVGALLIMDGISYEDVFFCRNYDITITNGELTVKPAVLTVKPDDIISEYKNEPSEYTYTITGMAPWDSVDTVFQSTPVAKVDYGRTGGFSAYNELGINTYPGVILMDPATLAQKQNGNGEDNYTLPNVAIDTGDLTVTRVTSPVSVNAISKVYDGSEILLGIDIDYMHTQDNGMQTITHYRSDALTQPLTSAPVEVGSYIVVVEVSESDHYKFASARDTYVISKATPDYTVPSLPDIQYSSGIKLSAQALPAGWTWVNPGQALSPGVVSAMAVFIPKDTANYHSVFRFLSFTVTGQLPPIDPPVDPPIDPPVDPPIDPSVNPPENPSTPQQPPAPTSAQPTSSPQPSPDATREPSKTPAPSAKPTVSPSTADTDHPLLLTKSVAGKPDKDGMLAVDIPDSLVEAAIADALRNAKNSGKAGDGIALRFKSTAKGAREVAFSISEDAVAMMLAAGVREVILEARDFRFSLDLAALEEIYAGGGYIDIVVRLYEGELPEGAAALIGKRPVWEIALVQRRDAKSITQLEEGVFELAMRYTPEKSEKPGNLFILEIESENFRRVKNSPYADGWISWTGSGSVFGVGYEEPENAVKDTGGHWASESIAYMMSRGYMTAFSGNDFRPDKTIAQKRLIETLAKLSGDSFPAKANYDTYAEWAFKNNITKRASYEPDRAITRLDAAKIIHNYCKYKGYTLPKGRKSITFSDVGKELGNAFDAVRSLQQAGIVNSRKGNSFKPDAYISRAEFAVWVHRLTALIADESSIRGWATNDSGEKQYYNNHGTRLTGEQNIGGKQYLFDSHGTLVETK